MSCAPVCPILRRMPLLAGRPSRAGWRRLLSTSAAVSTLHAKDQARQLLSALASAWVAARVRRAKALSGALPSCLGTLSACVTARGCALVRVRPVCRPIDTHVRGERVQTVTASVDRPRSVTFGLYSGSPSRRALGKRDVTADNAIDASSRASGAPRQKYGPCPNAKW